MQKEITLAAKLDNLETAQSFFDELLEEHDCPMRELFQIDVSVEEIFVNIANYAYPGAEGEATLMVEYAEDPRRIIMTFIDQGIAFNPLDKKDADVTLSAEEREIGGLGILMVKKNMTEMKYRRENDCNVLTLIKEF